MTNNTMWRDLVDAYVQLAEEIINITKNSDLTFYEYLENMDPAEKAAMIRTLNSQKEYNDLMQVVHVMAATKFSNRNEDKSKYH